MIKRGVVRAGSNALCVIFIMVAFLPAEFYLEMDGIRLEPYRVFLIFAACSLASRMFSHSYSRSEVALLGYVAWVFFSMVYNHGAQGVESGGVHLLEVVVSYFIGLSVAGNVELLRRNAGIILFLFLCLLPFAVVEATDGYRLFHVLAGEISGVPYVEELGDRYFRHGLHRASTVFAHPILYAVIGVMFLPLLLVLFGGFRRVLYFIGVLGAAVTSVSSVAFIMLAWTIFMYFLGYVARWFGGVYKLAFWGAIVLFVVLGAASDRGPVLLLISTFSLDQDTAYTRYLQWMFAASDISANPLVGIGLSDWSRPFWLPVSIDSHWLLVTLRHGYPAVFLLGAFFWLSMVEFWKNYRLHRSALSFSLFVSVSSFVIAAFTVAYFDRAHMILYLVMGFYGSFLSRSGSALGGGDARKL